jgi:membrane carboxypeptidase/penicillin-binding protein PbpC
MMMKGARREYVVMVWLGRLGDQTDVHCLKGCGNGDDAQSALKLLRQGARRVAVESELQVVPFKHRNVSAAHETFTCESRASVDSRSRVFAGMCGRVTVDWRKRPRSRGEGERLRVTGMGGSCRIPRGA